MLELKEIKKEYSNKRLNSVIALDGFSYKFPSEGIVFILGHSGSGKTTLLNLIGALDKPSSGEILFDGVCINKLKSKQLDYYRNEYVSFIFQDYNLLEDFTVYENLNIASDLNNPKADHHTVADELLKKVKLEDYGQKMPYMLSGGEKQRVAIARALVKKPKIILADEPTGALDEDAEKLVMDTLKELSRDTLVILVTHNKALACDYADEIIELSNSKIKKTVRSKPRNEEKNASVSFLPHRRKLSKKHVASIAVNNIKRNKFRFIIASVVSIIALTLFGISDVLQSYTENNTLINSIYQEKITNISLRKEGFLTYPNEEQWYSDFKLTENDILQLEEETGENLLGVYHPPYADIPLKENQGVVAHVNENYGLFSSTLSGLAELTEKDLSDFSYTLIAGKLPDGKKDEIVLTRYTFESFKLAGYRNFYYDPPTTFTSPPTLDGNGYYSSNSTEPPTVVQIKTYNDLIGKTIYVCQKNFTITGIIDTSFDMERYANLSISDTVAGIDAMSSLLCDEIDFLRSYGDICIGFVGKDKINEIKALYPSAINIRGLNLVIKNDYISFSTSTIGKYSEFDRQQVPTAPIEKIGSSFATLSSTTAEPKATKLINTDNTATEDFTFSYFDASAIEYNQLVMPSHAVSKATVYKDGKIFYSDDYFIPNKERCSDLNVIISYDDNRDYNLLFDFEIVASYFAMTPQSTANSAANQNYSVPDMVLLSDELFDELAKGREDTYTYALSTLPQKKHQLRKFMEACENEGADIKFSAENILSYELDFMGVLFDKLPVIAGYINILLIFLSMLAASNYLATTIHQQKLNLSILRSLGTRRTDIFKIFTLQCSITALTAFVFSSVLTLIIALVGNTLIKSGFNILLSLLIPSPRQFLLIFILSFLSVLLGGIFPLTKLLSKSVIDAKNC